MEREFNLAARWPPNWLWLDEPGFFRLRRHGQCASRHGRKGEACAGHGATAFIELLHDIDRFDLTRLMAGPLS